MSGKPSTGLVVFDYDGTLVLSNELKHEGFRPLFPEGPELDRFVEETLNKRYALSSRYQIIAEILGRMGEVIGDPMTDPKVLELAEQYNQNVTHGAATCAELPGATRCLEALKGNIPMVLLSATPEESLQEIIRIRNWGHFFEEVLGYPRYKPDELARLMKKYGVSTGETWMVGDSGMDERAATENGVPFWDIRENDNLQELTRTLLNPTAG